MDSLLIQTKHHSAQSGLGNDDHTIYLRTNGSRALAGAWDMGNQALTNVNIDTGNIANDVTHSQWDAAYAHSQSNSQAHSDYLRNNASDSTSGTLTAAGFTTAGILQAGTNSKILGGSSANFIIDGGTGKALMLRAAATRSLFLYDDSSDFVLQKAPNASIIDGITTGAVTMLDVNGTTFDFQANDITTTGINRSNNFVVPDDGFIGSETVKDAIQISVSGDADFKRDMEVARDIRVVGASGLEGTVTVGNAYDLPSADGTANFLVKTDGVDQWGYVDPAQTGTGDWGFWHREDGTGTITTLTGGDNVTLGGTLTVDNIIIDGDVTTHLDNDGKFRFEGDNTSGGTETIGFEIDFASSPFGPTISGTSTITGSNFLLWKGVLSARDNQTLGFGNATDATMSWQTPGNDYFRISTRCASSEGSGNIVIINGGSFPAGAYPIVANPTLRLQATGSTIDHAIQFWHDGTDGNIQTLTGDMNLIPFANVTIGNGTDETVISATGSITQAGLATATLLQLQVINNVGFYGTTPVTQNQLALGSNADAIITQLQRLGLVREAA